MHPCPARTEALNVRLLWLPEAMPGTLFAAVDVLRAVQLLQRLRHPDSPPALRWRVVDAAGRPLALPGMPAPTAHRREAGAPPATELLVLPGLAVDDAPHLGELMGRHDPALRLVARHASRGGWIAAPFNSLVLPAHLGLLDGQALPAPWPYQSWLARVYPHCDFGGTEPVSCAGAVYGCLAPDLVTALMLRVLAERFDAGTAQAAAQVMQHQPERQRIAPTLAQRQWLNRTADSPVQRALDWLQAHLEQPYRLKDLASAAATSERTLLRQFREVTGRTPLQALHRLRIERCKLLLETTLLGLDAIALACGYADTASLRRLFRRETGLALTAWRERHTLRARRSHWRARRPLA